MKAILTLSLVIIFGATALANTNDTHDIKVETIEMGIVLDSGVDATIDFEEIKIAKENEVVRVYKRKNARVTKAILFTTKRNRAKLA